MGGGARVLFFWGEGKNWREANSSLEASFLRRPRKTNQSPDSNPQLIPQPSRPFSSPAGAPKGGRGGAGGCAGRRRSRPSPFRCFPRASPPSDDDDDRGSLFTQNAAFEAAALVARAGVCVCARANNPGTVTRAQRKKNKKAKRKKARARATRTKKKKTPSTLSPR